MDIEFNGETYCGNCGDLILDVCLCGESVSNHGYDPTHSSIVTASCLCNYTNAESLIILNLRNRWYEAMELVKEKDELLREWSGT